MKPFVLACLLLPFAVAGRSAGGEDFDVRIYRLPYGMAKTVAETVSERTHGAVDTIAFRNDLEKSEAAFVSDEWDGSGLVSGEDGGGDSIALSVNDGHKVFWGEDVTMEYLAPRDDGHYELKTATVERGLRLALRRSSDDSSELWLHIDPAVERQRLDGVSLDVGPPAEAGAPVWVKRAIRTVVGEWSAVAFPRDLDRNRTAREIIMVFVRANSPYAGPPVVTAATQYVVESKIFAVRGLPGDSAHAISAPPIVSGEGTLVSEFRLPDGRTVAAADWVGLDDAGLELEVLLAPRSTVGLVGQTAETAADDGPLMRIRVNQSKGDGGGFGEGSGGGGFGGGSGAGQEMMDTWLGGVGSVLRGYLTDFERAGVSVLMDRTEASATEGAHTTVATAQRVVQLSDDSIELEYVFAYSASGTEGDADFGAEVHVPIDERGAFLLHVPGYPDEDVEIFVYVTAERIDD